MLYGPILVLQTDLQKYFYYILLRRLASVPADMCLQPLSAGGCGLNARDTSDKVAVYTQA